MLWLLWVIYQNWKGSGTSFWCTFSAWIFKKNAVYLILYQWAKFHCQNFFPSQDIKQNLLLSSYLENWWRKIYLRKQWLTGWQRGEDGNTKIWIFWEEKEAFRLNHLSKFLKGYYLVKNLLKNSGYKFYRALMIHGGCLAGRN